MKASKILNLVYAIIALSLTGYFLFGFDSCRQKKDIKSVENKIDSIQIIRQNLIQRFNCNTNFLFNQDDFTYKKIQILNQNKKALLVRIELFDIAQKNDSVFTLTGECWDDPFFDNKCIFEIKKSEIDKLPEKECIGFCVIRDLKLTKSQISENDEVVLNGQCIYFKKIAIR